MSEQAFFIPLGVVGKTDISRLIRELEDIEDVVRQGHLKKADGTTKINISQVLQETAQVNTVSLKSATERKQLMTQLSQLRKSAPVVHLSFAASPRAQFMGKITSWFRREVHPHALLEVGLQPSIAAGCVVRTTSKYFDFSLRKRLLDNDQLLAKTLREKLSS